VYSGPRACIASKTTEYNWNWRAILMTETKSLAKSLAGTVVNDDIGTDVASVVKQRRDQQNRT